MRFPAVTSYDNVIAQTHLLTEFFGIEKIQLVVGFSMSAQQTFHWRRFIRTGLVRLLRFVEVPKRLFIIDVFWKA